MAKKPRSIVPWLSMSLCIAFAHLAAAQENALTREDLEAMLRTRDAVIVELQHTVNELRERLSAIEQSLGTGADGEAVPLTDSELLSTESTQRSSKDNPTQLVIDEAAAERALERTLVQAGALLLPRGTIEFVPTLSYSLVEFDVPVIAVVGTDLMLGSSNLERSVSSLDLTARYGLIFDSQLEIGLPYRWVMEETKLSVAGLPTTASDQTGQGIGDYRIGFAKTLVQENGWRPDLVGRVTWGSGTGDEADDGVLLGSGFESVSSSLSFVKRRDPLAFFFSLGYQDVREKNGIDPGDQYSVSFGTALAASPESSLFGSITRRSITETTIGTENVQGSNFDVTTLGLGLSTILGRGSLFNISAEIGISEDAPDYSLGFSMPVQWRLRKSN